MSEPAIRNECDHCGAEFHTVRTGQRFCSDKCRSAWHREHEPVPAAVLGTRRAMREMADGSIRVQIEIDPPHRKRFMELFSEIDQPVALALVTSEAAQRQAGVNGHGEAESGSERVRTRTRSQNAARLCRDLVFQEFVAAQSGEFGEDAAAKYVRAHCEIESRAELDTNDEAWGRFAGLMREYSNWLNQEEQV